MRPWRRVGETVADFGTYSLSDVAAQVMEKDAKSFRRDAAPLGREDEITRYWKVSNHLKERVRAFLDLYGDGDHYVVTPPATTAVEVHAILNPCMDDGVSESGLFRVVRNWEDPQFPGIVLQTLRRGWITALVSGTTGAEVVDWTEARIPTGEVGSKLTAPIGAGSNKFNRRRVVSVIWNCVDPTKRNAVAEALMALTSTHAAWGTPSIRGESLGSGWVRLGVTSRLADDGSGVVELVLAQGEAVFESFTSVGTIREARETVVHGVPADFAQGYVDAWRIYGGLTNGGTVPRGGSASAAVDPATGQATLRFSWRPLTASPGAVVIGVWRNASNWQLHFIGWNQSAANLAAFISGNPLEFDETDRVQLGGVAGWMVNTGNLSTVLVDAADWSMAQFDYDDETERFQWHVILRPIAEGGMDGKIAYTVRYQNRRMWDNTNRVWVPQFMGTQYAWHHMLFDTFEDAWDFRKTSYLLETPYPRLIGDKWLAVRGYATCCTGWCDEQNEAQQFGEWVNPDAYDVYRFGGVPAS
ncbi:MAG: hypothetical protein WCR06_04790 [bacterium]